MKSLLAFIKKETMEQFRSGRLMILGILFVLLGVMNPAVAKITPWLLEILADSLAESGMTVTPVTVSAMDSWVQFFKNMPLGLIVFVLLQSSIFTKEYQSGTLVLSLTKGLERFKVVVSKTVVLTVLWTVGYWLCFGITYGYNAYFWDNSVAQNLILSVVCWWLFGVCVISLMILFSTIANSNTGVLVGTGSVVLASYLRNGEIIFHGLSPLDLGRQVPPCVFCQAVAFFCSLRFCLARSASNVGVGTKPSSVL